MSPFPYSRRGKVSLVGASSLSFLLACAERTVTGLGWGRTLGVSSPFRCAGDPVASPRRRPEQGKRMDHFLFPKNRMSENGPSRVWSSVWYPSVFHGRTDDAEMVGRFPGACRLCEAFRFLWGGCGRDAGGAVCVWMARHRLGLQGWAISHRPVFSLRCGRCLSWSAFATVYRCFPRVAGDFRNV